MFQWLPSCGSIPSPASASSCSCTSCWCCCSAICLLGMSPNCCPRYNKICKRRSSRLLVSCNFTSGSQKSVLIEMLASVLCCLTLLRFPLWQASQPLGAVSLLHYSVARTSFTDRPFGLILTKGGTVRHCLAAENSESVDLWLSVLNHAAKSATQVRTNV